MQVKEEEEKESKAIERGFVLLSQENRNPILDPTQCTENTQRDWVYSQLVGRPAGERAGSRGPGTEVLQKR